MSRACRVPSADFSAWAGALASLLGLGLGIEQLKAVATRDRVPLLGALLAAAVLLVDVGPEVGEGKLYQGEVVYGLVVSIVVLIVLLTVLTLDHTNLVSPQPMPLEIKRVAYAISALLWLAAAIALTVRADVYTATKRNPLAGARAAQSPAQRVQCSLLSAPCTAVRTSRACCLIHSRCAHPGVRARSSMGRSR